MFVPECRRTPLLIPKEGQLRTGDQHIVKEPRLSGLCQWALAERISRWTK